MCVQHDIKIKIKPTSKARRGRPRMLHALDESGQASMVIHSVIKKTKKI